MSGEKGPLTAAEGNAVPSAEHGAAGPGGAAAPDAGTVIVTGGCGAVGGWVVAKLAQRGYRVVAYDRVSRWFSYWDPLRAYIDVEIGDSNDLQCLLAVAQALARHYGAHPVHTPGIVGGACDEDPATAFHVNVQGTVTALEAARRTGARIVCVSTGAVYGSQQGPVDESAPVSPTDLYGSTKACAE
eukprot:gene4922-5063_t